MDDGGGVLERLTWRLDLPATVLHLLALGLDIVVLLLGMVVAPSDDVVDKPSDPFESLLLLSLMLMMVPSLDETVDESILLSTDSSLELSSTEKTS